MKSCPEPGVDADRGRSRLSSCDRSSSSVHRPPAERSRSGGAVSILLLPLLPLPNREVSPRPASFSRFRSPTTVPKSPSNERRRPRFAAVHVATFATSSVFSYRRHQHRLPPLASSHQRRMIASSLLLTRSTICSSRPVRPFNTAYRS